MFKYLLLFISIPVFAQDYQLEAFITNMPDSKVYLADFYNGDYHVIDSSLSANGAFYFHLDELNHPGMYRFLFSEASGNKENQVFIEFVWNKESFQILANFHELNQSVTFPGSRENDLLSQFREYEELYEAKMNSMYQLIDRYPVNDDFYSEAKEQFVKLQEDRDTYILELVRNNKESYAARIISSYRSPVLTDEFKGNDRIVFLQEHFFDRTTINDPALLYAPVYGYKIIEYLRLYSGSGESFEEQQSSFIEAVDIIMANVSADQEIRSFVAEYMLEGFESFGMERVQTYIVDNYVDETCETDALQLAKERVEGFRKMEIGKIAADILIRGENNQMIRLSELDADYTLVLFWATYCHHCARMMPKLKEWYETEKPGNLEVFAVSIDTLKADWNSYLDHFNPPWIDAHEALGWEGRSAEDYNVYATPTMLLLDRQRKIVAKPLTIRDLKKAVKEL